MDKIIMIFKAKLHYVYILIFVSLCPTFCGIEKSCVAFEYVFGNEYYSVPNISQPSRGANYLDPDFHTSITRVSDVKNDTPGNGATPVYGRYTCINSNNKYSILKIIGSGYWLYDIEQNKSIKKISRKDPTECNWVEPEFRWDYSGNHAYRLYYVVGMKFYQIEDVTADTLVHTLIHDFSNEYPNSHCIYNDDEGDSSGDSRYWAWIVDNGTRNYTHIIVYDKSIDKIVGDIAPSSNAINFVDMSPSGSKVVICSEWTGKGGNWDGPHAWNKDFSGTPIKVGKEQKHSGWAWDRNGNEMWVQEDGNYMVATNITTGERVKVISRAVGSEGIEWYKTSYHISRIYSPNKMGWILFATHKNYTNDYDAWCTSQIFMVELLPYTENPRIWRIAHSMNKVTNLYGDNYWDENFANMNIDGTLIMWNNSWRGTKPIESYIIKLPKWWCDLSDQTQGCALPSPPTNLKVIN